MDCEVDQALAEIAQERAELEKELEALSNDLKAAYAKASTAGGEEEGEGETTPLEGVGQSGASPSACDMMEVATEGGSVVVKKEIKEEEKGEGGGGGAR